MEKGTSVSARGRTAWMAPLRTLAHGPSLSSPGRVTLTDVNAKTLQSRPLIGVHQRALLHWSATRRQQVDAAKGTSAGPAPGGAAGRPAAGSGGGTNASNAPRGLTFLRRHPILALSSFALTHVGVAWALLPPTYFVLHNLAPGGATTLLAGPQTAWLLSKQVPGVLAGAVPGFRAWSTTHLPNGGGEATLEDLLEYTVRNTSKVAWRTARSTVGFFSSASAKINRDSSARQAAKKEEEEVADEAVRSLRGKKDASVTRSALDKLGFSRRAQEAASEVRFGQVRDAVAAYVFVKTLFPLRLPLSFWLAPKLGRGILAALRR